jgi:hypothetical protein
MKIELMQIYKTYETYRPPCFCYGTTGNGLVKKPAAAAALISFCRLVILVAKVARVPVSTSPCIGSHIARWPIHRFKYCSNFEMTSLVYSFTISVKVSLRISGKFSVSKSGLQSFVAKDYLDEPVTRLEVPLG